jgi:hypothetical protein
MTDSNKKAAPNIWDYEMLQNFQRQSEAEIRNLAPALSDDQILDYYGLTIDDLSNYDKRFFTVTAKRGRLVALQNAASHLFDAMKGKDALAASLAYLTRHGSDTWRSESGTGAKSPKTVKIVLED